jgi:hypothetical protein
MNIASTEGKAPAGYNATIQLFSVFINVSLSSSGNLSANPPQHLSMQYWSTNAVKFVFSVFNGHFTLW